MSNNKYHCRIEKTFRDLKSSNKPALITFITAGDPDLNNSKKILLNLPKAGADIIEIGVPFTDPMADGPIIQKSYKRALLKGVNLDSVLKLVKIFRETNNYTPIIASRQQDMNSVINIGIHGWSELDSGQIDIELTNEGTIDITLE